MGSTPPAPLPAMSGHSIPRARGLPLFGNMFDLLHDTLGCLLHGYQELGPISASVPQDGSISCSPGHRPMRSCCGVVSDFSITPPSMRGLPPSYTPRIFRSRPPGPGIANCAGPCGQPFHARRSRTTSRGSCSRAVEARRCGTQPTRGKRLLTRPTSVRVGCCLPSSPGIRARLLRRPGLSRNSLAPRRVQPASRHDDERSGTQTHTVADDGDEVVSTACCLPTARWGAHHGCWHQRGSYP